MWWLMANVAYNARQSACVETDVGISLGGTTYNMTGAVMMVHIYILTRECSLVWGVLGVNGEKKKNTTKKPKKPSHKSR